MYLKNIKINNFRNYESTNLNLSPNINIIYGNNAQGKTNLLESIYFLAITKSHRTTNESKLIRTGEETLYLKGDLKTNKGDYLLELGFDKIKKKLKINKNIITKKNEYITYMKLVIFAPEDMKLVKDGPIERRKFLNVAISQVNSNYLIILNDYNKLLNIRNDLLRKYQKGEQVDEYYFEIITQHMIKRGKNVIKARNIFIEKLNYHIKKIYMDIFPDNLLELEYKTNIKDYENDLKINKNLEIKSGNTIIGPHKDDLIFSINNENIKVYGSQGQQRVAVLALKLAQLKIYENLMDESPILLLDDVFSELDDIKKNNLLKYLKKETQVIITTTDLKNIDNQIIQKAKKIQINKGNIENIEVE
ncbi:MAG: DNA replication/repair protein RecF [Mycoplasmatota bacterium]